MQYGMSDKVGPVSLSEDGDEFDGEEPWGAEVMLVAQVRPTKN
jgi:hypothetical protein